MTPVVRIIFLNILISIFKPDYPNRLIIIPQLTSMNFIFAIYLTEIKGVTKNAPHQKLNLQRVLGEGVVVQIKIWRNLIVILSVDLMDIWRYKRKIYQKDCMYDLI
jgi:hypothetical protein